MLVTPEPIVIVALATELPAQDCANAYSPIVYGDVAAIVIEFAFVNTANAYSAIV